ncbi:regulator of hemoglobinization and erythroid cell expansion protein isoform 2-T2 [Guaruba guarouba]
MSTCEWKVPVAISAVTLVLHALLLLTLYIMLSRKIATPAANRRAAAPRSSPSSPRPLQWEGKCCRDQAMRGAVTHLQRPRRTRAAAAPAPRALAQETSITHPWCSRGKATDRDPPLTMSMWTQRRGKLISGPAPAQWLPSAWSTQR